jgi:hypothetical protein
MQVFDYENRETMPLPQISKSLTLRAFNIGGAGVSPVVFVLENTHGRGAQATLSKLSIANRGLNAAIRRA